MVPWFQSHRRRQILAEPFPSAWQEALRHNVRHYGTLTPLEQAKLRDDLRILLAEKNWEGCGGLVLTDEIRVTVAAQACLLLLGWEQTAYDDVQSILLYPDAYVADRQEIAGRWQVVETPDPRLGQFTASGTVVLSWSSALAGGRNPEREGSTVIHEFAHALDFRDGRPDGVPRLPGDQQDRWSVVMAQEYNTLTQAVEEGKPTFLGSYGATNAAEFFAVATERFFCRPRSMRQEHPDLYRVFQDYYRQDPAARARPD